ncbi:M23 family metallopeptidase [Aureimonas populi]|uniref:Peptidoglycan DD-metalloendopeptidase family protein n=1 Tax=Aureimonas populi TaxID=1701758 RepID=A0ABW5CGJ2_9HYPH|nr:M23 family metallopeptidase [Aureimonas populi]
MGEGVMRVLRQRWVRSVAVASLAAVAAGCSNDVARLNDGFYTGAIPSQTQQAAARVDPSSTGSIPSPDVGAYGAAAPTYSSAATPSVSRSQLPPPPGAPAAAYQQAPQPGEMASASSMPPSSPAPVASAANTVPQQRPATPPAAASTPAPVATAAASSAPAASNGRTVTVQSGDSLNAIARRAGVSVSDLRAANGLASDNIRIGQTLNLPSGAANTQVAALGAPETTLQAQAQQVQQPPAAPAQAAPAQPAPAAPAASAAPSAPAASAPAASSVASETQVAAIAPESTGISQFRWPVQGRVVRGFGDRVGSRRNDGVDISVPRGTPVKAAENGVVIYAGEGLKEFGKTVLVKHDNGLVTVYGHADEILVERGANVRRGQDIAKAGMTGDTDVPVLHFEVRKDSTPVDPMGFLG